MRSDAGKVFAGRTVDFSIKPGASGASATFSALPYPLVTDSGGYVTVAPPTANGTAGTFKINVSGGDWGQSVDFDLTNN